VSALSQMVAISCGNVLEGRCVSALSQTVATARGSVLEGRCVSALSQERAMVAYVTNCYAIQKCQFMLCYT